MQAGRFLTVTLSHVGPLSLEPTSYLLPLINLFRPCRTLIHSLTGQQMRMLPNQGGSQMHKLWKTAGAMQKLPVHKVFPSEAIDLYLLLHSWQKAGLLPELTDMAQCLRDRESAKTTRTKRRLINDEQVGRTLVLLWLNLGVGSSRKSGRSWVESSRSQLSRLHRLPTLTQAWPRSAQVDLSRVKSVTLLM